MSQLILTFLYLAGGADVAAVQACLDHSALTAETCQLGPGVFEVPSRAAGPWLGSPRQWMGLEIISNPRPVTLRGSGPATVIRATGDCHGADFYMIGLHMARDVTILDLTLDGSGRTAGFNEQQHLLNVGYGSRRVRIERVNSYHPALGPSAGGDVIRLLGGYGEEEWVTDVVINALTCIQADRSCIGFQRSVRRVQVDGVLAIGTGDQDVDMEATGVSTDEERIRDVTIARLTAIRFDGGLSVAMGRGDRMHLVQSVISGGQVFLLSCRECSLADVAILGPASPGPTITVRRSSDRAVIRDSYVTRSGGTGALIEVYADSEGAPQRTVVQGNHLVQGGVGPAVTLIRSPGARVQDNDIDLVPQAASSGHVAISLSRSPSRVVGNEVHGAWYIGLIVDESPGVVALNNFRAVYPLVCDDPPTLLGNSTTGTNVCQ